jgi:hypothetical protein
MLDADLPPIVELDVHENVAGERQVRQGVTEEGRAHLLEELVVDGLVDMPECVHVPMAQRQLGSHRRRLFTRHPLLHPRMGRRRSSQVHLRPSR